MTRAEAIDILKCGRPFDDNPKEDLDEFNLALGVAIKALKNENALLDRVLEIIDIEHEYWGVWDSYPEAIFENIRTAVEALKGGELE